MHEYRILDLFSGIGGFSIALNSFASTVAYCDNDIHSQQVLAKNMSLQRLDKAPTFTDVTKLNAQSIRELNPNIITAGFPCTDISSANPNGKGLKGERSGLFKEILRLIDELPSINVLFLENSPRIIKKGFRFVKKSLIHRGFSLKYCLISAKDVGALHKRLRWYCVCVRNIDSNTLPRINESLMKMPHIDNIRDKKLVKVTSLEQKKMIFARLQLLGNTIVPQCAMAAWNLLVNAHASRLSEVEVKVNPINVHKPLDINISDGITTYHKDYWATPCRVIWHNYSYLSKRGSTLLSNQLYFNVKNDIDKSEKVIANPNFVEKLMGYPINWTL